MLLLKIIKTQLSFLQVSPLQSIGLGAGNFFLQLGDVGHHRLEDVEVADALGDVEVLQVVDLLQQTLSLRSGRL